MMNEQQILKREDIILHASHPGGIYVRKWRREQEKLLARLRIYEALGVVRAEERQDRIHFYLNKDTDLL